MQDAAGNTGVIPNPPRRSGVQSIARAGSVLRALEGAPEGLGLSELAVAVDLPKSTVHRLVGALGAEELVSVGASGTIHLGGGLIRLAAATRRGLRDKLRPVLEELHAEVEETVDLSVLDGRVARFVDQLSAPHRLRAVSAVGVTFPLHCTANGKALLAALPPEQASGLVSARLERYTPNTVTSRSQLLVELERVRRDGVAFDLEEYTEGICAVAATVFDASGPAAAISIPVPKPRFEGQKARYAKQVQTAAAAASRRLGLE